MVQNDMISTTVASFYLSGNNNKEYSGSAVFYTNKLNPQLA